jgi:hypothetical protein
MKKFMMVALVAIGFIVIATPESNAGVSIGVGFGFPGFSDTRPIIRMVTIRLLSITAACTGPTIGGTAVGFLFDTATSARLLSIFASAVLSRAASSHSPSSR